MKVLIADKFPEPYIDQIRGLGSQVVYEPKFGAAEIVHNISDKDVVVVRSTKVTAKAIEATQNLSLIIRAGAGTNNIDQSNHRFPIHHCVSRSAALPACRLSLIHI